MRKTGYYWIKLHDISEWEIGYYSESINRWTLNGDEEDYKDFEISLIDETKIERKFESFGMKATSIQRKIERK